MIELEHVTKLYGNVIGVNDIVLSLAPGAYGLLGPNGSGKSTLLNLMTGQLRPTLGRVRVLGGNPWNNAELYRRVGFCPGFEGLYSNVSGYDWVRYLAELHGFGRHEAATRAEQVLELVGLKNAMHREMGRYSRGMRQRTKLAQALVHEPDFLILDEPFNGLDPVGRHDMTEILRDWIREGRNLLLASHILHEVEVLTQSFLLICGGRLLASGTAAEVHTWLADIPNEVTIRCTRPRELGTRLLNEAVVESVRFERSGDAVVVTTRSPLSLYEQLPVWIDGTGIEVREIQSSDESLQELFGTLMRMHRGEIM